MDETYRVYINEVEFFQAASMNCSCLEGDNEYFALVKMMNVSNYEERIKARAGDTISICFFLNAVCVYEFEGHLIKDKLGIIRETDIHFAIKLIEIPELPLISVLTEWSKDNDFISWKKHNFTDIKKLWLDSCLYWKGICPPVTRSVINVSLSLKDVRCYEDFFCMLGEAFFGAKGYMGKDFDGFDDCLSELMQNNTKIYIEGLQKTESFLKKISPTGIDYYDVFMNIITQKNCIICD